MPTISQLFTQTNPFTIENHNTDFSCNLFTINRIDTSTNPVTAILPPTPNDGDQIKFLDAAGSNPNTPTGFGLYPLTIAPSGKSIQGFSDDLTIQTENSNLALIFNSTSDRWDILDFGLGGLSIQIGSGSSNNVTPTSNLPTIFSFDMEQNPPVSGSYTTTLNGNSAISTAEFFTGTSSLFSDDLVNSYLEIDNSSTIDFADKDFEISFAIKFLFHTQYANGFAHAIAKRDLNNVDFAFTYFEAEWYLYISGVAIMQVAWTPLLNIWYEMKLTRTNNTFEITVDGTSIGTETSATLIPNNPFPIRIGGDSFNSGKSNIHIDDFTFNLAN